MLTDDLDAAEGSVIKQQISIVDSIIDGISACCKLPGQDDAIDKSFEPIAKFVQLLMTCSFALSPKNNSSASHLLFVRQRRISGMRRAAL